MRADRLLAILLLLQAHGRLTARELARRLEVSERTIHRDLEALSAAGVPVYAQRGAGGGWFLPESYRTEAAGLHDAEVRALFLGAPPRLLADLGLLESARLGLTKLLAALPKQQRDHAERVWQRMHVDVSGWRGAESPGQHLATLQEAVWRDQCVRILYRRVDGTVVERTVAPLGMVAKGSIWYLVGMTEGEPRTYRISRVQQVTLTDQTFDRPPDFDLAAYWEETKRDLVANLPRFPLTLRARPEALPHLQSGLFWSRIEDIGPPDAAGWHRVEMRSERPEDALALVLSRGRAVEVIAPASLRVAVRREVEAMRRRARRVGCPRRERMPVRGRQRMRPMAAPVG